MWRDGECFGGKPEAVEAGPTCVFVREGFSEIEQMQDGEPTGVAGWSYREARMSAAEYAAYVGRQASEALLDVQEAVAEMYEAIVGD